MMKKSIAFLLTGVCALSLLAGCGKEKAPGNKNENKTEANANEAVTLGEYKGIEISLPKSEVTEADVKEYIESMIAMYESVPMSTPVDKTTVEEGDGVNIDYEGLLDGVAFEGGSAKGHILVIGSDSFIDGFEDGLIGAKVGETVALNLTFPDPYKNPDMAGKAVVFNVKVNGIVEVQETTYDTMTDEYVKNNFGVMGVETVQALKDTVESQLKSSNEYYAESNKRAAVLEKLNELCTVEVPKELLDERINQVKEDVAADAKEQYDMELSEYLEQYNQTTEEEFLNDVAKELEELLKQELILVAIAEKEGITVDEEGFQQYLDYVVSQDGSADKEALLEQYGEDYFKNLYLGNKALDVVVENASVTYTEPEDSADGE